MITFKKIIFQNFLSVGNTPTEIVLNEHKTTLIHGVNGSGKSTLLDALTYCLFGKPFRNINLSQLINAQNKKGLLTEVHFSIGSDEYIVQRGQKPKIFTISKNGEVYDNKAADKDTQNYLTDTVLKLSHKSFCQIVILGSTSYVPFMQMTAAARRECVEDFLDIKVFSMMGVIGKERLKNLKTEEKELIGEIGNLEFKIDTQERFIQEIQSQSESQIETLEESIKDNQKDIKVLRQKYEGLCVDRSHLHSNLEGALKGDPEKKFREFGKVEAKIQSKVESLNKTIDFYSHNDTCESCKQSISQEIKDYQVSVAENLITKNNKTLTELQSHTEELQERLEFIRKTNDQLLTNQNYIWEVQKEIEHLQKDISKNEDQIQTIRSNSGSVDREKGRLDVLESDLRGLRGKLVKLKEEISDHEIVVALLKDSGIKTQVIKKYLPTMNKLIRKYLSDLDYPIHFQLDDEFNEHIRDPQQQNFSYSSFSEGQKGRIDLALLFTWREVCRLKNSVSCNLLVLDEVFSSSLDEKGKECLLDLLRYGLDNKTNVVVVDHTLSGEFKEKFDRSIEVQRVKGFSQYHSPANTLGLP